MPLTSESQGIRYTEEYCLEWEQLLFLGLEYFECQLSGKQLDWISSCFVSRGGSSSSQQN